MKQPLGLVISLSVVSVVFLLAGALLLYSPALFVRVYRKLAVGDYYAKSPEWSKKVDTPSSRVLGALMVGCGLFGFYSVLKMFT